MFKPRRGRQTPRERAEEVNRGFDAWGKMFGKPEIAAKLMTTLPPKRDRVRRPVDGKPIGPTEHQEQSAVIAWWWRVHHGYGLPSFALFACPNGGARDVITGAKLKAEGVRRGTPDLFLDAPRNGYHGLRIEMKVGSNRPSEEQAAFIEYLNKAGYKAVTHWSADAAIEEIKGYLG